MSDSRLVITERQVAISVRAGTPQALRTFECTLDFDGEGALRSVEVLHAAMQIGTGIESLSTEHPTPIAYDRDVDAAYLHIQAGRNAVVQIEATGEASLDANGAVLKLRIALPSFADRQRRR